MNKTILITVIFALTGCVTGTRNYQEFSDGVGYKSEFTKDNIYRVSYIGTSTIGFKKLNDLVFLRSAELAIEKGYDYFIITKSSNNRKQAPNFSGGVGVISVPSQKPWRESNLVIKLFKFDPGGEVYNARQVEATLKEKYNINDIGDIGV
ncbi:MAG: hypothetical protein HOH19_00810 [Kordiimonadaceae bacterium]|jgi:hypothetical protein|nr:hypothetical protein [Kordiimonadaceae bacterium]MBT6031089.1 hypothetical protein [Kordiimonadaceae bacterium]